MSFFAGKKSKEFWILMAISLGFYALSTLFEVEDLKNVLIVVSAIFFVVALVRLRKGT